MRLLTSLPFIGQNPKSPRQILSTDWAKRSVILQPDVNLFCWRRPKDPAIELYLKFLVSGTSFKIQCQVSIDNLKKDFKGLREQLPGAEQYEQVDVFLADLKRLTRDFLAYSEHRSGTLHLRLLTDNACTKFHTDAYRLRLFTTYRGRGTEWLPESAVNRKSLGTNNHGIIRDPLQIRHMQAFEVGILKGEVPSQPTNVKGIVHRSPQISHLDEKRVICRIDI